jgi:hypothetical protein
MNGQLNGEPDYGSPPPSAQHFAEQQSIEQRRRLLSMAFQALDTIVWACLDPAIPREDLRVVRGRLRYVDSAISAHIPQEEHRA